MSDWQPHTISTIETVDPAPVAALSALLDSGAPVTAGDVLPPLWHWVALPRWTPSSVLGLDGHPRRGDFLPPIDLPRRMFAGGEVVLHGDVRVGDRVAVSSSVTSMQEKTGRSGRLVLVQVTTTLSDPEGDVLVTERQDLVYRPAATTADPALAADPRAAAALAPVGPPLRRDGDGWRFVTDPTLLMRFSAATANTHRIHYDWPYATRVEGYPGLVVHGPLSTLVLAEALRLQDERRARRLRHRNIAPLFCGTDARVTVTPTGPDEVDVAMQRDDGTPLASLTVRLGRSSVRE